MSRQVIVAVDDIFFAAKIRAAAEHLGINILFARSEDEAFESALENPSALIIADLHSQKLNPFWLGQRIKADERLRDVKLIGFFSHVQIELQRQAQAAGFDQVMPRSVFTKNLAEILNKG